MSDNNNFEIPYEYLFLTAMNNICKYGAKKRILKDRINDFLEKCLDEAKYNAIDLGYGDIKFIESDFDEELDELLEEYQDYFYEDGDEICIHDGANMEDIDDVIIEMEMEDKIHEIFEMPSENIDFLKVLGCTYVNNEATKLLNLELSIEKAYLEFINNPTNENRKKVATRKFTKVFALDGVRRLSSYYTSGVVTALYNYLDKYKHDYDKYPINVGLWDSIPHKNNISHSSLFTDNYQFAIFGDRPLGFFKLSRELDQILESKNVEDDSVAKAMLSDIENEEKINRLYYKKYLKYLDEYIELNGETPELLKVKARLSYYIEREDEFMYSDTYEDSDSKALEKFKVSPSQVKKLSEEAHFFIVELFSVPSDENTIKKLLMMKTYYNTVNDKEFEDMFDLYSEEPNFKEYKDFVFGKSKTLSL